MSGGPPIHCNANVWYVTRGLDPRVHHSSQKHFSKEMDCRVKPGNDRSRDFARRAEFRPLASHHLNLP
jgi:hypothetical protein